ncbi:hypothetical protein [Paenibacillus sp. NPDC093718]|uniref:hypothetical protein n=1 Tax=Paenibacillus sp. NPDC093718 TaxID=3390601 RepID=UPI003D07C433
MNIHVKKIFKANKWKETLLLSTPQVLPVGHIATIYQTGLILWLTIMAVLLALKGSMELALLVRYGMKIDQ